MIRYAQIFLLTAGILAAPFWAIAQPRLIHVEWQYPDVENVAGYRLYSANNLVCEAADPDAVSMDCTVDVPDGEAFFTLTAYFLDGSESPPSEPFSYIFSSALKALVTADPLEGEAPLPVSFDASSSTGGIIKYEWMFGDGAAGSGSSVTHTFAAAGSYDVTLQVTDDLGATDRETVTVTVTSPAMNNTPPTAVISSSVAVGNVPLQVQFDGSSSTDSDGTVISYQWDLGDGGTATGPQVTHTYNSAGTFTATLTVTDDGGLTDSVTTPVLVSDPPPEDGNILPVAAISVSSNKGLAPFSVLLNAKGSNDPDGKITGYSWNFGDGTSRNRPCRQAYLSGNRRLCRHPQGNRQHGGRFPAGQLHNHRPGRRRGDFPMEAVPSLPYILNLLLRNAPENEKALPDPPSEQTEPVE